MKIDLTHNQGVHFTVTDEAGFTVNIDASPQVGGTGQGFRPMGLFLAALVSCTSIDTVLILNKSRKNYQGFKVEVEGVRREEIPTRFQEITMTFSLESEEISADVFHRAVDLSLTKYCSVAEMIRSEVLIRAQVKLNGAVDPRIIEK